MHFSTEAKKNKKQVFDFYNQFPECALRDKQKFLPQYSKKTKAEITDPPPFA